jgi:GT2 family glycosyltransferase
MTDTPIVIAVLTYRRPEGLALVLTDLVEHLAGSRVEASILVIDNDEQPSARDSVGAVPDVRYVHEPTPGIAAARNRALAESHDQRLLIFIDDDEQPQPGWIDALVDTWRETHSAAVVGPVVSRFTTEPDPWIEAGGFFRRLRHPSGTRVSMAATNNLLLDLDVIRRLGLTFDERFGLSGGSDSFFTRSLVLAGEEIVWCDQAIVTDVVPSDRLTRSWVLQRARRLGNSASRVAVLVAQPGPQRWLVRSKLIAQAMVRLVGGGGRAVLGKVIRNQVHEARGARTLARGRGMLSGAVGGIVVEYGRSNGREVVSA